MSILLSISVTLRKPQRQPASRFSSRSKSSSRYCLSFSFVKNKVKVQPSETRSLTVVIEVDTAKLFNPKRVDPAALRQPITKLLVARLKHSKVLFSYFLTINLVDGECTED